MQTTNSITSAAASSPGEGRRFRSCGWAVCLLWSMVAATLLAFVWHRWPVLDDDAMDFVPPMVTYAKDGSLVNAVNPLWSQLDPVGGGRLIYHGFLYEMVVGKSTASATYPSIILTMGIIEVLALGACAFVLYRAARLVAGEFGWARFALVALGIGGIASALISLRGRPEPFAMLLVALAAGGMFLLKRRWHFFLVGVALGLMAATHPTGTLLCGPVAAVYASTRCGAREWFAWLAKALVVSLAVFGITAIWYPYHIWEWVEGLLRHSSIVFAWDRRGRVLQYWLTVPRTALYGPLYLVSLVCGLWLSWKFRDRIRFKAGFLLSGLAFLLPAYFYNVRNPEQNYDFILAPLVYGVLIVGAAVWLSLDKNALPIRYRNLGMSLALTALTLTNLGFLRSAALFPFFLKHGLGYDQARARLQEIRAERPDRIDLDAGLFSLTEDYRNLTIASDRTKEASLVVVQQVNRGRLLPPQLENYELIEDGFSRVVPRCLGVKLGNTVGGYNFAVYRRTDLQRKQTSHE